MGVSVDTLAYAKRLREAGCPERLAEVQAEALAAVVDDALATKQDLRELEYRLTLRLGTVMTVAIGAVATLVKLL